MSERNIPIALTIAGSDSGGGAGIQADLKAFSALGVYGASAITAITAQNTREVRAIHPVPLPVLSEQICAVFDDLNVAAVKTGMLGDAETVACVADTLEQYRPAYLVVDPVMVAKSGDALLLDSAVETLKKRLFPLASLITPNLPEAAVLLGCPQPGTLAEMETMVQQLFALGAGAVLLKGGHLEGTDDAVDLLFDGEQLYRFCSPRIATRNTHGTGCTLASAITAGLASGLRLPEAVQKAKDYIATAISAADRLQVGHGQGPVHHFYRYW
ncbi:bifunctional hydroxymethylpyrimidine kinase/phosphomethylpyrimidine kinase [Amphritea pacifica]|uniref:hydroxymethylpyrimidine kinase n=1 Tax=Amphritea pacifica TaxID=2811233 RepID=A0ABS2W970_9GAMM|nr:bifunctional hydroxymethylpyrimidine kinase/phosphomethylpyrimidine kinase [Amphritea pacifica]MBN0988138.1 bifunctional hydroxymethylpyrimidine kinase/phosphomethylpyrimidine kinase [Amphritea pacifica]MBN1007581.1 bifunctional hydroxymethylpyrimidine kinase/phosphomethylpyrimidine kinase [Amphritea pacifica]